MQTISGNGHMDAEHVDTREAPLRLEARAAEPFPLVIVEWLDAWFDVDLESVERRRADYPVRTVGYLLAEGRVFTIAQELLPDGEGFRAVTHIPASLVQRVVELDPCDEPRPR
jgi:hypothetical protein